MRSEELHNLRFSSNRLGGVVRRLCSTNRRDQKCVQVLDGNLTGRNQWEEQNNIKMDLIEGRWGVSE